MATVPITGAAGVACLAAAAGAKSWLRAHRRGGPGAAAAPDAESADAARFTRGPCLEPGHAVALFDGATGYMVTVSPGSGGGGSGGGGRGPAVELRRAPAVDESEAATELPAFPAEALFVVVEGHKGGGSVCLRSVG